MRLLSTEFDNGAMLPERFAAEHANLSPPLYWRGAPANAQSFALVCEDPDAGRQPFMHWAIYNIPANVNSLPENGSITLANSDDIFQATNGAGSVGWFGPKPPGNELHHYQFRLLALDEKTNIRAGLEVEQVLEQLEPHIIEESDLTGTYRRH
jgi:Raf kinase inhibitor-like YbhB/YbcL family protein